MAPEIHMGLLTSATQLDLQKTDIWSLGLLVYSLVNPNLANPYLKESENVVYRFDMETMKKFMQSQQLPSNDEKYESLRVVRWWQIDDVFSMCAKFDPNCRPGTAEVLSRIENPDASLTMKQLSVSQSTAIEKNDVNIAQQLQINGSRHNPDLSLSQVFIDDGTNSCTFLAVKLCDMFLDQHKNGELHLSWTDMSRTADKVIREFPRKIHALRDTSKTYDASEVMTILASNRMLSKEYELSEECISGSGVFSESGRSELLEALISIPSNTTFQVGVHTCSPYAFMIGLHNDSFFLIDTHSIGEEVGGNGNGILVATSDRSPDSGRLLTQWILKRLWISGVNKDTALQSLVWLVPFQGMVFSIFII